MGGFESFGRLLETLKDLGGFWRLLEALSGFGKLCIGRIGRLWETFGRFGEALRGFELALVALGELRSFGKLWEGLERHDKAWRTLGGLWEALGGFWQVLEALEGFDKVWRTLGELGECSGDLEGFQWRWDVLGEIWRIYGALGCFGETLGVFMRI